MRALSSEFTGYGWAPSTAEVARIAGIDQIEVVRYDGNVAPAPLASSRPGAIAGTLARINTYAHGGYPELLDAIARYVGVGPENVVLGAGADDLILLCARAFAGPDDTVAVPDEPTYPLFRIGAWLAGAEVGGPGPALTFCCRPNNPSGALDPLPDARPLAVDEAYYEYCNETAVDLINDGVIVIRTFSKAFGLAGARIGYALAGRDVAGELNKRQHPAPLSTLSAALALAGLAAPPDVTPILQERERMRERVCELGFEPLPSHANFLYLPVDDPPAEYDRLLQKGLAVRPVRGGIRITIRTQQDDDRLLQALQS
jgi:histidinol-phosphate/aromatic aminotransferase/cobyric acid decarboxylase-like protein